jgi:two-component system cell cycle response regulator
MPKILIADDHKEMVDTLAHLFSFYQFEVISAENGEEAITQAENEHPDIILLDAYMPVMDGFEACKILKKKRKTKNIPIVFLTAKYLDAENRISSFELGADDYLLKPFNSKELVTRIKAILKKTEMMRSLKVKNEELTQLQNRLAKEVEELQKLNIDLEENLILDHLSGLYNKKYLLTRLKEEFHRALRYEIPISFILIDVDSFGRINDSLGYKVGDYILMKIANVILTNTRIHDIVARLEGDYFAAILPHTDAQGGFFEAERLRVSLNQAQYIDEFLSDIKNIQRRRKLDYKNLTVSLGVATWPAEQSIKNDKELFAQAKKALDKAKMSGKNKTVSTSDGV